MAAEPSLVVPRWDWVAAEPSLVVPRWDWVAAEPSLVVLFLVELVGSLVVCVAFSEGPGWVCCCSGGDLEARRGMCARTLDVYELIVRVAMGLILSTMGAA